MSPEHDPNLQPSAVEAVTTELPAEESNDQTAELAESHMPSANAGSTISSGAATAVVRAQESPETLPVTDAASEEMSVAKQDGSAPLAAAVVELGTGLAASENTEAGTPTVAAQPTEIADSPESSETMDQLLDQFAVPEPVAVEGEIFDGRGLGTSPGIC
jgi:hypothetical protein